MHLNVSNDPRRSFRVFLQAGWPLARVVVATLCVGGALMLGGCGTQPRNGYDPVTVDEILRDVTPELESVAMGKDQHRARNAQNIDTTMRQIHNDMDALLLIDRPRRMTRYAIP